MKKKVLGVIGAFLMIAAGFTFPGNVLAAAEEGSGGGADEPLTLVTATIADGQKEVPQNQEITFEFSKNVVNLTVKENNQKCFTVTDHSGQPVGFTVLMADDQIDRDKRNFIGVAINDGMTAGESYTIVISKNLMAKNGQSLDRDYTFGFTVAGAAKAETAAVSEDVAQGSETSPAVGVGMNSGSVILAASLGILAVLAVLFIFWKKKNGGKSDSDRKAE